MMKIWVIAPYHYERTQAFERMWKYDREKEVVSIGWNLGNLANLTLEEIAIRFFGKFPSGNNITLNQIINFWQHIQPGDRIIARGGRKKIVGLGIVNHPTFYDPIRGAEQIGRIDIGGEQPDEDFLPVRWESVEEFDFQNIVFGILTVTRMRETSKHWPAIKDVLQDVWDIP